MESVRELSGRVGANPTLRSMLEAMPLGAVVLNDERQIVAANSRMLNEFGSEMLETLAGKRIGAAVGCVRAATAPAGCGSSEGCPYCGVLHAIAESRRTGAPVQQECRVALDTSQRGALDVQVLATPITIDGTLLTVVALRDISSDKRRRVLERLFFHDVLNTAGGMCGIAGLLLDSNDPSAERELKQMLVTLSEQLVEEINSQRQLIAAESGELQPSSMTFAVADILRSVQKASAGHPVATGRTIEIRDVPDAVLTSDMTILRRILGNMVKNALEATSPGGTVTLWARDEAEHVLFGVRNETVIPDAVRHQIFQRSFSTKGEGRGIGTYSVKLLAEKYLQGQVAFSSDPVDGTTFTVRIPKQWSEVEHTESG